MKKMVNPTDPVHIERSIRGRTVLFRLEGELTAGAGAELAGALDEAYSGIIEALFLNLEACDVESAEAVSTLVSALKGLLERGCLITLFGSPQLLAHNLYRAGLTRQAAGLRLLGERNDEPLSS